ncbi:hypothetical protein ACFOW6_12070 [Fodinicurvata halophila]|uniref:Uncharacterized protein n=1 Tax=Fodinicurvata halophila TaxID=1419723 RepID=A0ABV8ULZ3_9PROT
MEADLQIKFPAALIIFIGSYFPLSLILIAQDYNYDMVTSSICNIITSNNCIIPFNNGYYTITFFIVCLLCFLISLGALSTIKPKTPVNITQSKYIPAELMSYTLPYIVSFMSIDYQETGKFVGLLVFLCWIFLITFRSGQLILNPLLIVFGWRLYEIKYTFPGDGNERTAKTLSKSPLQPGERYNQSIIQDIMIIKSNQKP